MKSSNACKQELELFCETDGADIRRKTGLDGFTW